MQMILPYYRNQIFRSYLVTFFPYPFTYIYGFLTRLAMHFLNKLYSIQLYKVIYSGFSIYFVLNSDINLNNIQMVKFSLKIGKDLA